MQKNILKSDIEFDKNLVVNKLPYVAPSIGYINCPMADIQGKCPCGLEGCIAGTAS